MSTPFYKQSPLPLIIDNEAVCTSHTFDVDSVESPGTAVATVCGATVKEAQAACAAAQRAGPEWRKMPLTERRKILLKVRPCAERERERREADEGVVWTGKRDLPAAHSRDHRARDKGDGLEQRLRRLRDCCEWHATRAPKGVCASSEAS